MQNLKITRSLQPPRLRLESQEELGEFMLRNIQAQKKQKHSSDYL